LLQTSTALNVASYLLLKAEQSSKQTDDDDDDEVGSSINSHPVITKLQKLNTMMQKLETNVEEKVRGLPDQMEALVKAVALMKDESAETEEGNDGSGSASDDDDENQQDVSSQEEDEGDDAVSDGDETSASTKEQRSSGHEKEVARKVLNEARFAFRPGEVETKPSSKKRVRRAAPIEYGDQDVEDSRLQIAKKSLSSTINSIEQRSASKKRKAVKGVEQTDEHDEEAMRRGLEMMEAELGGLSDDEDGEDINDGEIDGSDDDANDFYDRIKRKTKAKKDFKKSLYEVAPKYPRVEDEVEGERAVSKQILKNRGLVAHKNKLNRNPRVKKREQYRKALIRRKGKVREVRTDEGHKYGGEETGIKSKLSRSRRL